MITANSLIGGKIIIGEEIKENITPIDGLVISKVSLLSESQLIDAFKQAKAIKTKEAKKEFDELQQLANYFREHREEYIDQIMKDAGFIKKDSEDLVEGSIEFCEDYSKHLDELAISDKETSFSFKGSKTKITHTSSPYGLIAATTPRNTPLITELTIIIHALWSGNHVILRPSPGVSGTVALLMEGLLQSFKPETLEGVFITFVDAKNFVNTSLEYADLLHYVGSTKYLEGTLITGIKKGVKVLLDGDGCSMAIIDATVNVNEAVMACYEGLIRCNAQICISMRTIIIDEKIYEEFHSKFLNLIRQTKVLPPDSDNQSQMGPLFSSAQVENIIEVAKKYNVIQGQLNPLEYGENYLSPIVVELDPNDRSFLRESVFGPIVGLVSYSGNDWNKWLKENPINLTDAVFSNDQRFIDEFLTISTSPRRVVNVDPTIESVFEPWGAFLPSGWNDVSYWYDKYRNYYQRVEEK